jgi:hypothetical protein
MPAGQLAGPPWVSVLALDTEPFRNRIETIQTIPKPYVIILSKSRRAEAQPKPGPCGPRASEVYTNLAKEKFAPPAECPNQNNSPSAGITGRGACVQPCMDNVSYRVVLSFTLDVQALTWVSFTDRTRK